MTATPNVFAQRIAAAQNAMAALGLEACLVPSSDPHLSEYLPARLKPSSDSIITASWSSQPFCAAALSIAYSPLT